MKKFFTDFVFKFEFVFVKRIVSYQNEKLFPGSKTLMSYLFLIKQAPFEIIIIFTGSRSRR